MTDCTAPEDIFNVLVTIWPSLTLPGLIALGIAVVLIGFEFGMRFAYGGIPDGVLGALGIVALGIAAIIWSASWPAGCAGTISLLGIVAIVLAAAIGALVVFFWRARTRDGGMLLRGYDSTSGGQGGGTQL